MRSFGFIIGLLVSALPPSSQGRAQPDAAEEGAVPQQTLRNPLASDKMAVDFVHVPGAQSLFYDRASTFDICTFGLGCSTSTIILFQRAGDWHWQKMDIFCQDEGGNMIVVQEYRVEGQRGELLVESTAIRQPVETPKGEIVMPDPNLRSASDEAMQELAARHLCSLTK